MRPHRRPGPKSGTDLSDITQSPTDFFICSSPNYGRRPGTGLGERHGAVTHVHTVVRLEGIHHLLYASTAKALQDDAPSIHLFRMDACCRYFPKTPEALRYGTAGNIWMAWRNCRP